MSLVFRTLQLRPGPVIGYKNNVLNTRWEIKTGYKQHHDTFREKTKVVTVFMCLRLKFLY